MKTLLLNREDVAQVLAMKDIISAVEDGYRVFNSGKLQQPRIIGVEMPQHNGDTDIKSCYNSENEAFSVKIVSGFYDNGKTNDLPTLIGNVLIFDGTCGALLCVMDGSLITGVRTGASGAISSKYLARKDSKTVAVIGGGGQARMQVYALCELMEIETVKVYSPQPQELPKYKEDVEARTRLAVVICDTVEEAMQGADIAISTTPSKQYLASADLVKPGMHIVAVGADMEGKNEWDPQIFSNAKIVNDSIAECCARGETRNALIAGVITEENIYAEIGQIIEGEKKGRESDDEITIYDTVGLGIQDNVTAMRVYEIAKERNLGKYFEFF